MFLMYIDANSVTNAKGKKSSNTEDHSSTAIGLEFTTRDFYLIEDVQSQRRLFRLIVGQAKMRYISIVIFSVHFPLKFEALVIVELLRDKKSNCLYFRSLCPSIYGHEVSTNAFYCKNI